MTPLQIFDPDWQGIQGVMLRTVLLVLPILLVPPIEAETIDIGSCRELFVNRFLIERLDGASLKLHAPRSGVRPRPAVGEDRHRLFYGHPRS